MANISWNQLFVGLAQLAAMRSKDPYTKNGACIVNPDNKILGVGYNGLPRGCDDRDPVYWSDDDSDPYYSRHSYVVHAEVNAILNCAVLPLKECRIYTTQYPCPACTQAIIQAGICEIFYLRRKLHHHQREQVVQKMLHDSGVKITMISEYDAAVGPWAEALRSFLQTQGSDNI